MGQFLLLSTDDIVGRLAMAAAERGRDSEALQVRSWAKSVEELKEAFVSLREQNDDAECWGIALEFPVPRVGRRIDCVLLTSKCVYVIEYKAGHSQSASQALRQARMYAADLEDFHSGCKGIEVIPIALSGIYHDSSLRHAVSPSELGALIAALEIEVVNLRLPLPILEWDSARYSAVPTIIECATALFLNHSVVEIAHSRAGNENLESTKGAILDCIVSARKWRRKHICFVSGVPGSGKTLAGLNAVTRYHHDHAASGERTVFLSGNGPLIRVLREALRQNAIELQTLDRKGRTNLRNETEAFIQDMHRYATEEFQSTAPPDESVIVFDEAQRAWSQRRNREKTGRDLSEAEMTIRIMEKRRDWAVIVAIIGSGQEIHEGEAGIQAWIEALQHHNDWTVWAPTEVLHGFGGLDSDRVREMPSLHLSVSRRSHSAETAASWVNALLDADVSGASQMADSQSEFPIYMSRDLGECRSWMRLLADTQRRYGLVASSGACRLRAYGIEPPTFSFLQRVQYDKWFLAKRGDIRSSFQLEVAMSEFEMQGLELDRVCLCWGNDLVWDTCSEAWVTRKLVGSKWVSVRPNNAAGADCPRTRLINKYRVLLSRFRKDMVIFVPPGDHTDPTNAPQEFDDIANVLGRFGVRKLTPRL